MKPRSDTPVSPELSGYEVVVAVCGGIAAYKVCHVVSALAQRGVGVTVAMTRAARRFVGEATFGALSGRPVLTSLWAPAAYYDPQHVRLTEALDALLVAPATYNMIGKIASGVADDVVSTLVCSAEAPILLAPAMNVRMWQNPVCQENVRRLSELGYRLVGPGEGWLACRDVGAGRMAEAEQILQALIGQLRSAPPKAAGATQ